MKKILISVIIVLLIVMAYYAIAKGIVIGDSIKILSIDQIKYENEKLTQEIEQTEALMNSSYPTKTSELDSSVERLLTARDEYLDLASVSTEEEIKQATIKEEYTVEFLLTRLGRHATSNRVNLKYEITSGSTSDSNNINFTVSGKYSRMITFLTDIEDDSKLGFRIRNFKLVPGGTAPTDGDGAQTLTATFLVTNVTVKNENVSGGSGSTSSENTDQSSEPQPASQPANAETTDQNTTNTEE